MNTNSDNLLYQAEYSLIGIALVDFASVEKYFPILNSRDFSQAEAGGLWEILKTSSSEWDFLQRANRKGFSQARVTSCTEALYARERNLPWIVGKLQEAAEARRIRAGAYDLLKADDAELPLRLQRFAEQVQLRQAGQLEELPAKQGADFLEALESTEDLPRVLTGFPILDNITGGLRLGSVSVLGAFPSAGKTAFAMNLARDAMAHQQRVLFFSLEMTEQQLYERLCANACEVLYSAISNHRIGSVDRQRVRDYVQAVSASKKLYLFDSVFYVERMASAIVRLQPQLVVVDYLQKARTRERISNNAERLEFLVDEFKRLAMQNHCHILLLSQHSREANRERASLFTLKGSSGIEAGGDYILLLDRPSVYDRQQPPAKAELKLVKHKYGQLVDIDLFFEGEYQRFRQKTDNDIYPEAPRKEEIKPW